MTGLSDGESELGLLFDALMKADAEAKDGDAEINAAIIPPEYRMSPYEARSLPSESAAADDAEGRVAAESICAYPPGIPLIVPGEVFTSGVIEAARAVISHGGRIISSDKTLKTVKVVNSVLT